MGAEGWETGSGAVDEFDGVIRRAYFDFDPAYNNGDTLLAYFDVKSDDLDVGYEGTGEILITTPCGKGWDKGDQAGTFAKHEGDKPDKPKRFIEQSGMGLLIESVKGIEELVKVVVDRGDAREAKVWEGLDVTWKRTEQTFAGMKDEKTGEAVKARRWIITGFNGLVGQGGAQAASTATSTAATGSAAPTNGDSPISAVQKVQLKKLAGEATDLVKFQERVLTELPDFQSGVLSEWIVKDGSWDEAKAF